MMDMKRGWPGKVATKVGSSHYYLPESMPLALCGACLMVVLESSEKAKAIYSKIVESCKLPGVQDALSEADRAVLGVEPRTMWERNVRALRLRRKQGKEQAKSPLPDIEFYKGLNDERWRISHTVMKRLESDGKTGEGSDLEYWAGLVIDLIKVGFNNKSDQAKGIYRVTAETSPLLVQVIGAKSSAQFKGIVVVNEAEKKAIQLSAATYDLTGLLADSPSTRKHRLWTKVYKEAGYVLRHDEKIARTACFWYFSRVVYSGPEEFCNKMLTEDIDDTLYPGNVSNEIRACDKAIGYPRGE